MGGISWLEQLSIANRAFLSVAAMTAKKITAVGATVRPFLNSGKILQTVDGGLHWNERTFADSTSRLQYVQFVDSLHGWIRSPLISKIWRTLDGSRTWEAFLTPGDFAAVSFIDQVKGWAIRSNADVYQTSNGAMTWKRIASIWDQERDPFLHPSDISFVDSLQGWAFGDYTFFYLPYRYKGIYRTIDGGRTWKREQISSDPLNWGYVADGEMIDATHGWAVCNDGKVLRYELITEVAEKPLQNSKFFSLRQNYPNPFNPATMIEYEVAHRAMVRIAIHDILGREVAQLVNSEHAPGVHRFRFNASNYSSGVYYIIMKAGTFSETKPMTLFK